jgi:hypothetical protein
VEKPQLAVGWGDFVAELDELEELDEPDEPESLDDDVEDDELSLDEVDFSEEAAGSDEVCLPRLSVR